jgi:hypothetical protein
MNFTHYDLGHIDGDSMVEITLRGSAANVRLMDSFNLSQYRHGRQHRYVGGLASRSPVTLKVPTAGHWHVTVDMQGLAGSVQSGIRVLPAAAWTPGIAVNALPHTGMLATIEPEAPSQPPSAPPPVTFDVFISHAWEDKDEVARPLANALRRRGLTVWYDEFELRIGDSLRRKIDRGLGNSRFGVMVLSPAFFGKGWPEYELDGLVNRSIAGEQVLLPIWHKVTRQDVVSYSPSLADRLARTTMTHTIEAIANDIAEVVGHTGTT